ncbi:hypothetical protein O6H91_17G041500 [Diphasiastrum complanatum]|uniref:Uncharacterized protein n=1 Tax=Diphasiastrum complanatum TaxID=34168 RepID=A0ACC2B653_DIPCM|nr:hypothetical protein O6H91_17G041500 [Diphasiastrum complanatum]
MTMGSLKEMLRMVSPDECQALQDICEYNDITEEQLVSAPESITALEMFMHNLPRICCMSFFPNLVSLSLVQQSLTAIEGLHSCPYLKILRLSENSIQRIEGLNSCLRLQQLYLHGNQIRQIRNLNHLTGLEVLWLANNEIRRLEGLENLQCLKELNLACNPIDQLSEVLNLKSLEHLNVAATEIGSFKEIELLARLRRLQDLRFSDSNWGDSPLSRLHNYQTYVLFRLQHLQRLDTVDLADDVKQLAKATYTMKRVYYNMCVKSLQHNRNNIVCLSIKSEARRIRSLQKTLTKLVKTRKDLEKEMRQALQFEEYLASTTISCKDTQLLKREDWSIRTRAIIVALDDQISHMTMRLDLLKEETCLIKEKEQAAIDRKIHWLKLELDTGFSEKNQG